MQNRSNVACRLHHDPKVESTDRLAYKLSLDFFDVFPCKDAQSGAVHVVPATCAGCVNGGYCSQLEQYQLAECPKQQQGIDDRAERTTPIGRKISVACAQTGGASKSETFTCMADPQTNGATWSSTCAIEKRKNWTTLIIVLVVVLLVVIAAAVVSGALLRRRLRAKKVNDTLILFHLVNILLQAAEEGHAQVKSLFQEPCSDNTGSALLSNAASRLDEMVVISSQVTHESSQMKNIKVDGHRKPWTT